MFGWFFGKKEAEKIKDDTKRSFENVKKDLDNINKWVNHLNSEKSLIKNDIEEIRAVLSSVKEEVDGMKNVVSLLGNLRPSGGFRLSKQLTNKRVAVYADQTADQMADQTPKLDQFSVTERALLWILLNTEMKLSYDDLATMLGKEISTIRNQINNIKHKSEGLIEEMIEKNGKKRVFIPEYIKEILLKKTKVRVKPIKKAKNEQK
ncbi:MAG: hypothetical protein KKA64_02540 [Nanoarchaeota archaeon]|nr:hypothetical protein [Nanoarchaeota archaeon]